MSIVALVPAHNEETTLPQTLQSLITQSVVPDRIVVVSDNSTDQTPNIARSWGFRVELFETCGNTHKKAGAINQALKHLELDEDIYVLVVDADSTLSEKWIETALSWFKKPNVGAVGGIFLSDGEKTGPLSFFETQEYARYAKEIAKDKAKAKVLTGTATMVPMKILKQIERNREENKLPGAGIYDQDALTEDFSLTLAIKILGYSCVSPKECIVTTETMGTLPMFWRQRIRWQRGAVEALQTYGLNKVTLPYIIKQIELGLGLVALLFLYTVTLWSLVDQSFVVNPFWVGVGAIFFVERLHSIWHLGWKHRVVSLTVVPDIVYDSIISAVYITVIAQMIVGKESSWGTHKIEVISKE